MAANSCENHYSTGKASHFWSIPIYIDNHTAPKNISNIKQAIHNEQLNQTTLCLQEMNKGQ